MNSQQAKEFIGRYTGPNVRSFVKPSHLEELSPLLEVHIEAIEVRKDEFHEMEGGKAYMPRKETLDKFAAAAGVSYNQAAESTRLEGEGCYVGRSQAMVMGPDGKMIFGSACEYEFDVQTRTEEMELNGKADWNNKDQYGRPGKIAYTPLELKKELVNFRKVGRQRANTGARNRATVSILGMPTGIRNLFTKDDKADAVRVFLFSRIIINAKNEFVMNRMLDGIAGNTAALFGPATAGQIAAPARTPDPAAGARPAEDQTTSADDDELDFGGAAPAAEADQAEAARNALRDYIASGVLSQQQISVVQPAVDNPATPLEGPGSLMYYLDLCKKQEEARKRRAS
ncbi:MAG: hypothetical protein PHS14_16755 [Elusimicrobia bacterium]|nr:hypothetical protein [Elusimicrobiota bacterium]